MLKGKVSRLVLYNFRESIIRLMWTFVWFIGITILLPNLFSLTINGLSNLRFNLASLDFTIVSVFFLFADAAIFKYDYFKWTIQNGISRHTAWWGKIGGTLLLTAVIVVIDIVETFARGEQLTNLFGLAGHSFGANVANVIQLYIAFLMVSVTGLVVGYMMALLSKRGKAVVIIGVPVVMIVALTYLARALVRARVDWNGVINFIKVVLGYSNQNGTVNLLNGSLIMIVWILVCLGISYLVSQKLRLRRD
ncbi:hypothetical protein [Paucilactobacillus kaifaensis]|uniref:hypothetical protein n=1 Tax=Paucilactobacillus kaifaensis TaxID=2559921 RepID=UPI0010F9467B|nr:hypothetical protein [Paucilactobacillus kaifaensis]